MLIVNLDGMDYFTKKMLELLSSPVVGELAYQASFTAFHFDILIGTVDCVSESVKL